MSKQDSHLSTPGSGRPNETDMVRQKHRLAQGLPVTGQTKPNGAEKQTPNLIGNNQGKRY